MEEIWKDIKFIDTDGTEYDYTGLYQVSNLGRVKSFNYNNSGKEGILSLHTFTGKNYQYVTLTKEKKSKVHRVHRLVAHMFVKNPNTELCKFVNHRDEDGCNNCADNLEWVTQQENLNYGTRNKRSGETLKKKGSTPKCNGFKATNMKTNEVVFYANIQEARDYGYCDTMIYDCCNGKYKTYKGYQWEKVW